MPRPDKCAGWSAARRQWAGLPRPARWGASRPSGGCGRTTLIPSPTCRASGSTRCTSGAQPKVIVLDMDSSDSPTYGEQEGSAYNGHFGGGLVTFATGRIEIEVMAGDHQDFAGRHTEELCGALISLGPGFVDAQHLARDHRIPVDPVATRDIDHQ